ncbi:MAG: hypothetical protein ABJQ69_03765 [Ekhidna sp.]
MIVINYSTSFKALDSYIHSYNETKEHVAERIRQGALSTAKDIIRIYGLSLLKANAVDEIDINNLPSLKTNNVQLSKMASASTRTIQRHIKRLREAGIVTHKLWHGTNASYELWINPQILLAKCKKSPIEAKITLETSLQKSIEREQHSMILEESTTKCPHTDSGNTSNKRNNIIIEVHNSEDGQFSISTSHQSGNTTGDKSSNDLKRSSTSLTTVATGNTTGDISGDTGGKVQKKKEDTGGKMRSLRAGESSKGLKASDDDPVRTASLNLYTSMLWMLARNVLYKDVFLTEKQIEIGKKLLYQWYEPVSNTNLARVHEIYVERIGLVRKFVNKDPLKRFVQLPNRFFDPTNPSGFAGSKSWWNKQQVRKEEVRSKLILNAQIKRFINNEKKEPHKRKPPLPLYRECETRIGKLGDPLLLEQFHAATLHPVINNHIYN